jgi:hypothetical protein
VRVADRSDQSVVVSRVSTIRGGLSKVKEEVKGASFTQTQHPYLHSFTHLASQRRLDETMFVVRSILERDLLIRWESLPLHPPRKRYSYVFGIRLSSYISRTFYMIGRLLGDPKKRVMRLNCIKWLICGIS